MNDFELSPTCLDCLFQDAGYCGYWGIPLRTKTPIDPAIEGCTHAKKKGTAIESEFDVAMKADSAAKQAENNRVRAWHLYCDALRDEAPDRDQRIEEAHRVYQEAAKIHAEARALADRLLDAYISKMKDNRDELLRFRERLQGSDDALCAIAEKAAREVEAEHCGDTAGDLATVLKRLRKGEVVPTIPQYERSE